MHETLGSGVCVWDGFKLSFSATRSERARKRNNLLLEPIHLGTEPAGIGKEDEEEEGGGEEEGRKRDRSDSYRRRPPQAQQQRPPRSSMPAEESRIREKPHCGPRSLPDHHLWAPTQSGPASP